MTRPLILLLLCSACAPVPITDYDAPYEAKFSEPVAVEIDCQLLPRHHIDFCGERDEPAKKPDREPDTRTVTRETPKRCDDCERRKENRQDWIDKGRPQSTGKHFDPRTAGTQPTLV